MLANDYLSIDMDTGCNILYSLYLLCNATKRLKSLNMLHYDRHHSSDHISPIYIYIYSIIIISPYVLFQPEQRSRLNHRYCTSCPFNWTVTVMISHMS